MHPAKLVFQALRIHLNDEFGELRRGLEAAYNILSPNGSIGIITWKHSECAIVMEFFRKVCPCDYVIRLSAWQSESDRMSCAPAA